MSLGPGITPPSFLLQSLERVYSSLRVPSSHLLLLLSRFSRVRLHRRQPTRLPCPWDSPGKNTGVGCHCLLQCMKVKSESEVAQSCLTLRDPVDCSPPVHGIFQARVLEWGAIAFSSSELGRKQQVPGLAQGITSALRAESQLGDCRPQGRGPLGGGAGTPDRQHQPGKRSGQALRGIQLRLY